MTFRGIRSRAAPLQEDISHLEHDHDFDRPAAPASTLTTHSSVIFWSELVGVGDPMKKWPKRGLVQRVGECSQIGHVLDSPATKRLGHVSKEHISILTYPRHSAVFQRF
jgi:hypothetical protein